jgi:putative alpha-1,2-mannosidase
VEHAGRDCGCFTYARDSGAVTVRVATSFISQSQAATNFEQEVHEKERVKVKEGKV